MEFEPNRRDFTVLATKGGSLAGTLTATYYAQTKAGRRRVLALFLHDVPFSTWSKLMQTFAQQQLERSLLLDDDALERLRSRRW